MYLIGVQVNEGYLDSGPTRAGILGGLPLEWGCTQMRIRAGLILFAALILYVASAKANGVPIDPEVDVGGGSFSTNIFQSSFSFIVNVDTQTCTLAGGSGTFDCFDGNNQNQLWTTLNVTFPSSFIGTVTCNALRFFAGCIVLGNTVSFFGGQGIPVGEHFIIGVNNFPANTQLDVQANVPEPGTLGLFLAGIGALVARRKLHKR